MEGNRMKMREALKFALSVLDKFGYDHPDCVRAAYDCSAALSAPPRNCDRFEDELDAQLAFLNEVWLISVDRDTRIERDRFKNWTDEMRSGYAKWLYATAAERKGEGDAV